MQNSWLLCGAFHQKKLSTASRRRKYISKGSIFHYSRLCIPVPTCIDQGAHGRRPAPAAGCNQWEIACHHQKERKSSVKFVYISLLYFSFRIASFFPNVCVWRYRMELIRVSFKKVKTWVVVHARARSPSRIGLCDVMLGTHRSPSGWLILFNLGYKLKGVYLMPRPSRRPPWKLTSWRCWICMSMAQKKQVWL